MKTFFTAEFKTSAFFDRDDPWLFQSFHLRGMVMNPRHVPWYCVRRICGRQRFTLA